MASSIAPRGLSPEPRVRGRYMQTFLDHVNRLPVDDRQRIRAVVPAEAWDDIAGASIFSWLPFERNLVLTRAVAHCLGPKRTDDFFHTLLLATFKTPLLQSLVDAVVRMLGSDPSVSLGWVSKGFELMFKDAGTWKVMDSEPGAASLQVRGLPSAAAADRVWLQSVASSLGALFTIAKLAGATTIRDVEIARGTVTFRLRWEQV